MLLSDPPIRRLEGVASASKDGNGVDGSGAVISSAEGLSHGGLGAELDKIYSYGTSTSYFDIVRGYKLWRMGKTIDWLSG